LSISFGLNFAGKAERFNTCGFQQLLGAILS
jgi:hypothetical protein